MYVNVSIIYFFLVGSCVKLKRFFNSEKAIHEYQLKMENQTKTTYMYLFKSIWTQVSHIYVSAKKTL